MFKVSLEGVLALIAVLMCLVLAVVLVRVSARGSVARKLALLLVFEAITLASSDVIFYWVNDYELLISQFPNLNSVQILIHTFGDCGMLALYAPFLAAALNTRLAKPFANKSGQRVLLAYSIAMFIVVITTPETIGVPILYMSMFFTFAYAMVVSVHAWLTATGVSRSRAGFFAAAFGFRDICWGFIYIAGTLQILQLGGAPEFHGAEVDVYYIIYVLGTLVAVPMIAYGILRTQLFDIDLRIRWTIKQSTLAAAIVSIMFVISEGVDRFLSEELGSVPGLLAMGAVLFFLTPLQKFAERVAKTAMPNTDNTPEYAMFRKLQVYEAAVGEAQAEGGISNKERALLVRLRDSLGISEADANAIEGELQAAPSW